MNDSDMPPDINNISDQQGDYETPLPKLHLMLCVLMTKFHYHKCPKMAHFIVRHLRLMAENPELSNDMNSRTLYLQLLNQWQHITMTLIEQNRQQPTSERLIH
jgi:phosphoenolpyruvate carboxylase